MDSKRLGMLLIAEVERVGGRKGKRNGQQIYYGVSVPTAMKLRLIANNGNGSPEAIGKARQGKRDER